MPTKTCLPVLACAALAVIACRASPPPSGPPPVVHPLEHRATCTQAEERYQCLEEPLSVPPLVVAPGRIQMLSETGFRQRPFRGHGSFAVVEATLDGMQVIAEGECPAGSLPHRLGRVERRTAVVCLGYGEPVAYLGEIDSANGPIQWRPGERLRFDDARETRESTPNVYFADLGASLAFVFEVFGRSARRWRLQWAGDALHPVDLCTHDLLCDFDVVALARVGDTLHVVVVRGLDAPLYYADLMVGPEGTLSVREISDAAQPSPDVLNTPCVAQGYDGHVTIAGPLSEPGEWRRLTIGYERAWLPHGPDVLSPRGAPCDTGALYRAANPPVRGMEHQWLRATLGPASLMVYSFPRIASGDGKGYSYGGSTWVYRGTPSR